MNEICRDDDCCFCDRAMQLEEAEALSQIWMEKFKDKVIKQGGLNERKIRRVY